MKSIGFADFFTLLFCELIEARIMANFRKIRKTPTKELGMYRLPLAQFPSKLVFILPLIRIYHYLHLNRTRNCPIIVNAALLDC